LEQNQIDMPFDSKVERDAYWEKLAEKLVVGRKIVLARWTTKQENEMLMWDQSGLLLQLEDNTLLIFSQDDEGNGPGACFVQTPDDKSHTLPVKSPKDE